MNFAFEDIHLKINFTKFLKNQSYIFEMYLFCFIINEIII